MLVYAAIVAALAFGYQSLATAFVPDEDQGQFMTSFTLPSDCDGRSGHGALVQRFDSHVATRPDIGQQLSIMGFGFSDRARTPPCRSRRCRDYDERTGRTDIEVEARQRCDAGDDGGRGPRHEAARHRRARHHVRLLDASRGSGRQGAQALRKAADDLVALAADSKRLSNVPRRRIAEWPGVSLEIDRARRVRSASISRRSATRSRRPWARPTSTTFRARASSSRSSSRPRPRTHAGRGRAAAPRPQRHGRMVPLAEVVTPRWSVSPLQLKPLQWLSLSEHHRRRRLRVSSGAAMSEIGTPGFRCRVATAWSGRGQSFQERQPARKAPILVAFSFLVVSLVLAALYESWAIPCP